MIGLSCYILADTYFIATKMGSNGLTSLNLAIAIYSFIHGLGLMIGIGSATKFSICRSQGQTEKANETFTSAVILGIACGAVLVVTGIVGAEKLACILGARGEIVPMTTVYLRTILCFSPCFLLNNVFLAFVRNDKAPQLAMVGMVAGSLANIVMDYLFIFPMDLGMFGAALATGAAPVISLCILSLHKIKKRNQFHFCRKLVSAAEMIQCCMLGISAFLNEISSGVVLIVFNLLILRLEGNVGVAAYGIVVNLALVAISVFTGISQGMQPMVSRFYGSGQTEKARKIYQYATVLSIFFGVLFVLITFGYAEPLVAVFNSEGDQSMAEMAREGLRIYFTGFLFVGVNIVTASYLAAVEKAGKSFQISIFRGTIGILVFALILSSLFQMRGVWLAFPCTEAATVVLSCLNMRRGSARGRQKIEK